VELCPPVSFPTHSDKGLECYLKARGLSSLNVGFNLMQMDGMSFVVKIYAERKWLFCQEENQPTSATSEPRERQDLRITLSLEYQKHQEEKK